VRRQVVHWRTVLGLYIHIPFCAAICNYCNFNRGLFESGLKERYVTSLIEEIRRAGDPSTGLGGTPADTVFFGGGTPSLLEPEDIARILDACRASFALTADAEITLEANPETVTDSRLERLHSASRAREAAAMARSAGFDNLSLDLMMWLPQQSIEQWLESVDALIAVGPEHASLYLLEIYPNAPLRDAMARARWSVAPDDDAADMYMEAMARLDAAGYTQYEVSNVARQGRESRHNLKYWSDGEWLGFGCGAHSTRSGVRWKNVSSTEEYISTVSSGGQLAREVRRLSPQEHLEEALFTGLRLSKGVNLKLIESRHAVDVWGRWGPELQPFADEGLLHYDGEVLRLTRAGMLLAHEVMTVLISQTVR